MSKDYTRNGRGNKSPVLVTTRQGKGVCRKGKGEGGKGFPRPPPVGYYHIHIPLVKSPKLVTVNYVGIWMRTYKLYTASVSGNALCYVTIQRSGRIKSIRWAVYIDDATDTHYYDMELSTQAVGYQTTHDTIGPIDEIKWQNNVGAAGADASTISVQRLMDFPMAAGERLYLNGAGNAGASTTVFVDFAD